MKTSLFENRNNILAMDAQANAQQIMQVSFKVIYFDALRFLPTI